MDREYFESLFERVKKYLDELNTYCHSEEYFLSVGDVLDINGKLSLFNWSKRPKGAIIEILQGRGVMLKVFAV